MNKQGKNKIDWCDATINPVVGCKNNCEYCYARRLNDRFKWIPDFSKPQFYPERLKEFEGKKPMSIFVNSMSDVAEWDNEQITGLLFAITKNHQHNYIALSKNMAWFELKLSLMTIGRPYITDLIQQAKPSLYLGYTGTCVGSMARCRNYSPFTEHYNYFLNIEPIQTNMNLCLGTTLIKNENLPKAVIVGAETGNRKGKVIPEKAWIDDIVKQADKLKIRVFMKESLRKIMGEDFRQDELIWEIK